MGSGIPQGFGPRSPMDAKADRDAAGMKDPPPRRVTLRRRRAWGSRVGVCPRKGSGTSTLPSHPPPGARRTEPGGCFRGGWVVCWPALASLGSASPAGWLQLQGRFPKHRAHLRHLGPARLRSRAIRFQDITHKTASWPGLAPEIWPRSRSWDDIWLRAQVLGRAALSPTLRDPGRHLAATSFSLQFCETGPAEAPCTGRLGLHGTSLDSWAGAGVAAGTHLVWGGSHQQRGI